AGFVPFALTSYREPSAAPLPEAVRTLYVTEHSAGYGLREAVLDFPRTITQRDIPIIGSMFPDSCRRANFYAEPDLKMRCTDAPGLPFIEAALAEQGEVYVLVETPPIIGLDVTTVEGASVEFLGASPRPGETDESAAVKLWLLTINR
ncbi:MAG: hypothetical protein H7175_02080, partial [Burkholderiales bacterium]|nr:hypothetical protein [Anaerolineae bacterium]